MIEENIPLNLNKKQKVVHFKEVSFTYPTLVFFQKKYPEDLFSWVMGSEYLDRFDDFLKGHPKLLDFHFYIYPREGSPFNEKLKKDNMTFLTDFPQIKISSSLVKERIKKKKSIGSLVTDKVRQDIIDNKLYLD